MRELLEKINDADYVLIGIGEEFNENFESIESFPNIVKALDEVDKANGKLDWLVPFLEKCYIDEKQQDDKIQALQKLFELVKDKNYFVMTTCIDESVKKAGFDVEKIVEPCGNYSKLQCIDNCSDEIYDSDEYIANVKSAIESGKLVLLSAPVCDKCGKELVFNNIIAEKYSEKGYMPQWEKYTKWLQKTLNRKLCIIELGVGMNLPNVIRWPFEKIAFFNNKASFFRINETVYQLTDEIGEKGISINKNAKDFMKEI